MRRSPIPPLQSLSLLRALSFAGTVLSIASTSACGGGTTDGPTTVVQTPTITVSATSTAAASRGASSAIQVTVARAGGYLGDIALSTTGMPIGVTASFNPVTLSGAATTSTLTLTVTSNAAASTSTITILATGTGVSTTQATIALMVSQPLTTALTSLGLGLVPDRYTAELWVRGTTAYTTSWGTRSATGRGNAIKIWDVSSNTPTLVDSIIVENAGTLGDVQVSDDGRLLVAGIEPNGNGGLAIYQLDTPRSARLLTRTTGGELRYGVHTAELARIDGVLYAFCSIDPASGVPARLVIMSLANPSSPVAVASIQLGAPYIHDVFVRDGLLFTAEWNDGVGIWDIGGGGTGGTVAVPKRVARLATVGGKVHNVWWYQDPVTNSKKYLFVGEEGPGQIGLSSVGDVHVVDISTITAPVEVARYTVLGAGTHNFSVDEANGILYAAYYNGGVRAIDVRGDLGTCTAAQKLTDGRCDLTVMGREKGVFAGTQNLYVWGVHTSSSGLFASDMLAGLWRLTPAIR